MDHAKTNDAHDGDSDQFVADELARLLASPLFMRSPVLSRLLQYLAEHRLRGGRSAPKAYAIATEALGRNADFDPAVDSYPRVMVGRLRSLLDRYYADTAWVRRLRVPQGSYELVVQHRASPPSRGDAPTDEDGAEDTANAGTHRAASLSRARRAYVGWIAALVILAVGLAAAWRFLSVDVLHPAIEPMPVLDVSAPSAGDTGPSRALARALDGRLRDGLRRFDLVELRSARAPGAGAGAARDHVDYRLDSSIVRSTEGPIDVTLVLNRVADQRTIWSTQLRLTDEELPDFEGVGPAIAQIAGDYGIIVRDQVQREPENFDAGYPCLAQFNRLRQLRTKAGATRVGSCLRASLDKDPRDPVLLTALSLLRFGDWQPQRDSAAGKAAFSDAQKLARQAYEAGPNTAAGLFAMARAHFYASNCVAGTTMGEAALALNPYSPDITGFLGLFKASCGNPAGAEPLLRRSIALDSSYAGVPAVTLAFMLSQRGKLDEALAILNGMSSPSNMEPQYLLVRAIILARQGDRPQAHRLWQKLLAFTRQPEGTPPETVLRQFMITPAVIVTASAALRDSGVVESPPGPWGAVRP